ncbi:MAG: aldo/keto reductase [Pseudomonadota bacterium]|nr:aldo/keto reductase [Pseudomonadota bacterium]
MSFMRTLGSTGLAVSALGLGTVKFGRNEQVKYPTAFTLPDDKAVRALLAQARELGLNLLDTAPAYGTSEERLGQLLQNRRDWVIVTKTGEEFRNGASHFDFSAAHTRASIERSLRRLNTDYLDIVLIHSDGNDEAILDDGACVAKLQDLKREGLVRAVGMSTKTLAGGLRAVRELDVAMLTFNLQQQDDLPAIALAHELGKGVLIKKGLMSGHLQANGGDPLRASMELVLHTKGVHSLIAGTINPAHLAANVAAARDFSGD